MNDLIVTTTPTHRELALGASEGILILGNGLMVSKSIGQGDWAIGSLLGASTFKTEVEGLLKDPIAAIAGSAVSFCMEYFEPPRRFLDNVAGSPLAVQDQAQTWYNIGDRLREIASDYAVEVSKTHDSWQGAAGQAYRDTAATYGDVLTESSHVCDGIGASLTGASGIVAFVRGIVRAAIAELVGKVISWGVQAIATAGIAIATIVRDVAILVRQYIQNFKTWFTDLATSMKNLIAQLSELKGALTSSSPFLKKLVEVLSETADVARAQVNLATKVLDGPARVDPRPRPRISTPLPDSATMQQNLDEAIAGARVGAGHSALNQGSGVDNRGLDDDAPPD